MFTEELLKELLRDLYFGTFSNCRFWEKTYFSCGVQANRAMNRFLACMQAAGDWTLGTEIYQYQRLNSSPVPTPKPNLNLLMEMCGSCESRRQYHGSFAS